MMNHDRLLRIRFSREPTAPQILHHFGTESVSYRNRFFAGRLGPFVFDDGRFLPILGTVFGRVFLFGGWIANETLRFRSIVLLTPVSFLLEFGGHLRAAHAAFSFGNAVFIAPPAGMGMTFISVFVTVADVMFMAVV
jgi:hypothetical protein